MLKKNFVIFIYNLFKFFFYESENFISTDTRNNLRRYSQNKTNSKQKYKKPNFVLAKMQHKSCQTLKLENT